MKCLIRLTKLLLKQKSLIIVLGAAFIQAASAQNNGYWDDRFWPSTYLSEAVSSIAINDSDIFICGANSPKMWNGKDWGVPLGRANGSVIVLAIIGNDLYVGGKFTTAGGVDPFGLGSIPANNIAKWNFVTKSWSALESNGVNGTVWALAAHGNKLYVGGHFTVAGGVSANSIAVWNDSSKTWTPLGQGVDGHVRTIAVNGRELYVGGSFTSAGGVPANNIAKWDGREWCALGSGVNHQVNAIAILDRGVYVGGYFTKAGDVNVNCIAQWNIIDKSWSALNSGTKNGVYNSSGIANVYAIATNDRAIYVGGTFNMVGDYNVGNIAKWDPANNSWSPLGGGVFGGQVFALMARGNDVYVGGGFRYAGGKRSDSFAIWHEPNEPPVLAALPSLRFDEDKSLLYPLRN